MRHLLASTLLVLCAAAARPSLVEACSCAGPGRPCEAVWQADTVFTGTVASLGDEMVTEQVRGSRHRERLVSFDAVSVVRGAETQSMQVRTGLGGGDCGFSFEIGQTYVVYAYRNHDGRLETGICTRTARLDKATEDIAFIRGLATSPRDGLGWLTGEVQRRQFDPETGTRNTGDPVPPPVTITLRGRQSQLEINSHDGVIDARIPPGKYMVEARAPAGFHAEPWPKEVFLADGRGCVTVDVSVLSDGRVSGQVLDARGEAVAGIGVHAVRARDAGRDGDVWFGTQVTTDDDGRFVITRLGEGDYLVGPHLVGRPRQASSLRASPWITVKVGVSESKDVGELRLPDGVELTTIQGTVLGPDGAPTANAFVSLGTIDESERIRFDPAKTDERGHFTLAAIAGREYLVLASFHESPLDDNGRRTYVAYDAKTPKPVLAGESVTLTLRKIPER